MPLGEETWKEKTTPSKLSGHSEYLALVDLNVVAVKPGIAGDNDVIIRRRVDLIPSSSSTVKRVYIQKLVKTVTNVTYKIQYKAQNQLGAAFSAAECRSPSHESYKHPLNKR